MSPPIAGHVYDGVPSSAPSYSKDVDYQTDQTILSAFWEGFHDPHTIVKNYLVHVGTCYGCDDVLTQQYIGVHQCKFIVLCSAYTFNRPVLGIHSYTIEKTK